MGLIGGPPLFLTTDISLIEEWARKLQPAIIHLGAAPELLGLTMSLSSSAICPTCS